MPLFSFPILELHHVFQKATTCRKKGLSEHALSVIRRTKTYSSEVSFLLSCCTKQVLALRTTPLLKSFSFTRQYFLATCSRRTDLEFSVRVWAVAFVARSRLVHDSRPRLSTSCYLAVVFNWMKRGKERSAMLAYFSLKDGRNYRLAVRKTGST